MERMTMAMMESPAPVNLVRSIFLCNIFNFCLAASKACLIPFLTLYLMKLGLSATQTGLVIGGKTFVGMIFAPLWSKCAVRCGKRRLMLMFAIAVFAGSYLSLTAVPSMDENTFALHCNVKIPPNVNVSHYKTGGLSPNKKPTTIQPDEIVSSVKPSSTLAPMLNGTEQSYFNNNTTSLLENTTSESNDEVTSGSSTQQPIVTTVKAADQSKTNTDTNDKELESILKELLVEVGVSEHDLDGFTTAEMTEIMDDLLETEKGRNLLYDAIEKLPPEDAAILKKLPAGRKRRDVKESTTAKPDGSSSILSGIRDKVLSRLKEFQMHIRDSQNRMFIVIMVVLMVGEAVSSPIEKIADDGWFEFLESIDDMEKYGMQRIWSTFAHILLPVIVTLAVDNTNCLFASSIHPFMLHFHLFGLFLGITFMLAFCYPMSTSEKYKYATKVAKGVGIICCSFRHQLFVLTLLLMGMIYSSYYNFLFWLLADMGSGEITMGMCLSLAALAEIPMLLFNERLIKKIGNGGVVCLSLLFLSGRCLYYSFLVTPWAVLPAELCHAFTHTAMWWAVLSSPSFNTSAALSRSIRSILSTVYFGLGFGVGSIVSGIVYDQYGPAILFQAGAVVSIAWFPVLGLGVRCCREKDKSQVKYSRLLTSDDGSGDSDSMEDDWLEQALKDR